MKTYTTEELREIIKKHEAYLQSDDDGVCANLSYADLSNANLSDANLRKAILCSANLSNADLSYANLRNANLRYADLSYANLSNTDFHHADLRKGMHETILSTTFTLDQAKAWRACKSGIDNVIKNLSPGPWTVKEIMDYNKGYGWWVYPQVLMMLLDYDNEVQY